MRSNKTFTLPSTTQTIGWTYIWMQLPDKGMLSKKTNKLSAKFTIPSQFALNNSPVCHSSVWFANRLYPEKSDKWLLRAAAAEEGLQRGDSHPRSCACHLKHRSFFCLQFCRSLLLSVRVCNAWLNELFIFLPSSSLLIPFSLADGEVWVSACLTLFIWNLMLFFSWVLSDPTSRLPITMRIFESGTQGFLLQQPEEMDVFKAGSTAHHRAT